MNSLPARIPSLDLNPNKTAASTSFPTAEKHT
jgi:hypothetical protein